MEDSTYQEHPASTSCMDNNIVSSETCRRDTVLVPAVAGDELLEAVDALALVLVPEAAREEGLAVVTVLLSDVRGHALLGEEVLGADLGPAIWAAGEVRVEALGDLLALHPLAAVHDVRMLVLPGGVGVDGPRDGGIVGVLGARLNALLHERRGCVQGLADAANRARPLADLAPFPGSHEAGLLLALGIALGVQGARALVLPEARLVGAGELEQRGALLGSISRAVLAENDAVQFLLHRRLDAGVLPAQPIRASHIWDDDLAVELHNAILEAGDLAVVAIPLGDVPQGAHAEAD